MKSFKTAFWLIALVGVTACGDTTTERVATGGIAGDVVGGSVGAVVGGTVGAVVK